jgi:hypothetical protein
MYIYLKVVKAGDEDRQRLLEVRKEMERVLAKKVRTDFLFVLAHRRQYSILQYIPIQTCSTPRICNNTTIQPLF